MPRTLLTERSLWACRVCLKGRALPVREAASSTLSMASVRCVYKRIVPHTQVGGMFNPNIRHSQNFFINELLQQNVAPISYNEVSWDSSA